MEDADDRARWRNKTRRQLQHADCPWRGTILRCGICPPYGVTNNGQKAAATVAFDRQVFISLPSFHDWIQHLGRIWSKEQTTIIHPTRGFSVDWRANVLFLLLDEASSNAYRHSL